MFKIINKPWKVHHLGGLFGLGFDTSSKIALLGILCIQVANGTSILLILIFPVLFTACICLIDTMGGVLMLTLCILPAERFVGGYTEAATPLTEGGDECEREAGKELIKLPAPDQAKVPVAFMYYSIVLTSLTVTVALIIGTIKLLTLILNVAHLQDHAGTAFRPLEATKT